MINAMHITLYRSKICPRCHLARKYLFEIVSQEQGIQIEDVDVFAAPIRTWKDGIRMIPALKIDNHILSGTFLTKKNISDFVAGLKS